MKINPKATTNNLGGKGYQLQRLSKICTENCTVPPFFVVMFDNDSELKNEENQKEILTTFDKHGFDLVSVRSSATVEDGELASFAGIFESVLNVGKSNLISAIEQVLNCVKTERVKQYCELKGIDYKTVEMRIIVQKMVSAAVSGVIFTKTANNTQHIVVEACLGLGEALVGGKITPDNYLVNRATLNIAETTIGKQKTMLARNGQIDLPEQKGNTQKLTDTQIKEVAELSLHIEKSLNFKAADIEFAYANGKLYILQARAVTGLMDSGHDKFVELENSHEWKSLVTRHSTILDRDIYCKGITRASNIKYCGIDYFVSRKFSLKAVFHEMNEFTKSRGQFRLLIEQNPMLFKDISKKVYARCEKFLEFSKKYRGISMHTYTDKEIKTLFLSYTEFAAEMRCYLPMVAYLEGLLTILLQEEITKHPNVEMHNEWIQAQKDSYFVAEYKNMLRIGAEIQKAGLANINKPPAYIEKMIDEHIHTYEWFFTLHLTGQPMTREYTSGVLAEIIKFDCADRLVQIEKDFLQRNKNIEQVKSKGKELRRLIDILEEYAHLRTYRTDVINEGDFYMCSLLCEMATRLKLSYDEMNCLTVDEIVGGLDKKLDFQYLQIIIKKRQEYYTTFLVNDGEVYIFSGNEYAPSQIQYNTIQGQSALTGKVAHRGHVTGKAKIIWHAGEIDKMNKGDIIVATMTTPDMVVGILKCGGIISNEGGIASHVAQIAREFKIPCIMGTGNATVVLKDNDIVEIIAEGTEGIVNIIKQ